MKMFEEIDKVKKDFPKIKKVSKEVRSYKLNDYQRFSLLIFVVGMLIGVILGNLFTVCGSISSFDSSCTTKEFNSVLMIVVWSISLLVSVVFFWMGHVIEILKSIDKKLTK